MTGSILAIYSGASDGYPRDIRTLRARYGFISLQAVGGQVQ